MGERRSGACMEIVEARLMMWGCMSECAKSRLGLGRVIDNYPNISMNPSSERKSINVRLGTIQKGVVRWQELLFASHTRIPFVSPNPTKRHPTLRV